jgi:streptomycin 6-kinase
VTSSSQRTPEEKLDAILRWWPEHLELPILGEELNGFVSELVVKVFVEVDGQWMPMVAKISDEKDLFAAAAEVRLMRNWANHGLAPTVFGKFGRMTLLEWVDARPVDLNHLKEATVALRRCHELSITGLAPLEVLLDKRYGALANAGSGNSHDSVVMRDAKAILAGMGDCNPVPLHGDCHPRNVLFNGKKIFMIDPLGASGDRCFDIAMLAVTSGGEPYATLGAMRRWYGNDVDTLGAWFAWCAAFRYRVERNSRPKVAKVLGGVIQKLSEDRRWCGGFYEI